MLRWLASLWDAFLKMVYFVLYPRSILVFPTRKIYIDQKKLLGEGAFASVYRAYEANIVWNYGMDKVPRGYAVKKMYIQSTENECDAANEISALKRFKHPNIIPLLDYISNCKEGDRIVTYLLFPLMAKGSLRNVLNQQLDCGKTGYKNMKLSHINSSSNDLSVQRPTLFNVLNDFFSICSAYNLLHTSTPSYVHGDIKPENILIADDNTPILTDFGSTRFSDIVVSTRAVALQVSEQAAQYCTISYRAPELFDPPKGITLCSRTDVWGLGALLYSWWFGYSPFEIEFNENNGTIRVVVCSYLKVLANIPKPPNPSDEDNCIIDLCHWMLNKDISTRPYTSDVMERVKDILRKIPQNTGEYV